MVLHTPTLVIGDAHLGVASKDAERALLRLLRDVPARARSLVIMGDLFDFWCELVHVGSLTTKSGQCPQDCNHINELLGDCTLAGRENPKSS